MIQSSIDLGTNTCLLLIAELESSTKKVIKIIEDHSTNVRLGEGVDQSRALKDTAIDRTLQCLKIYAQKLKNHGLNPKDTIAVATATARDAKNGRDFFDRVEKETGFHFKTLTGIEEAQASFNGALLPGMDRKNAAIIDIGGGSTELMTELAGQSMDMGSVRFTERYLKSDPVTDEEFWECQAAIDEHLKSMEAWRKVLKPGVKLVAVAGTATTLAQQFLKMPEFNRDKIDYLELTKGDLHRMVEELKFRTKQERMRDLGIEEKRADVLLAGAMILWRTLECLNFDSCVVSTRGLRFGVF